MESKLDALLGSGEEKYCANCSEIVHAQRTATKVREYHLFQSVEGTIIVCFGPFSPVPPSLTEEEWQSVFHTLSEETHISVEEQNANPNQPKRRPRTRRGT